MSGPSKIMHSLVAAFAAILVSSVAVSAAVGPAQTGAAPVEASIHA
jgi:hypothetical protein